MTFQCLHAMQSNLLLCRDWEKSHSFSMPVETPVPCQHVYSGCLPAVLLRVKRVHTELDIGKLPITVQTTSAVVLPADRCWPQNVGASVMCHTISQRADLHCIWHALVWSVAPLYSRHYVANVQVFGGSMSDLGEICVVLLCHHFETVCSCTYFYKAAANVCT